MSGQQNHHIVVLGAGYGGLLSAIRLSGKTEARITLINNSPVFVERVRLHQVASGQVLPSRPLEKLLRGTRVQFVQGHVTKIDADNQIIEYIAEGAAHTLPYDTLVYALGSTIDRDSVAGVREHAHVLTGDGAVRLRDHLNSLPPKSSFVICGGGLTGIEAATEFAEAYPALNITLVTRDKLGETLSGKGRAYLRERFAAANIRVHDMITIQRVEPGRVVTDKGGISYHAVLWAGAFSVPSLARDSGITVNARQQMLVDGTLRSTSHPNIFGVGDAAEASGHPFHIRMACATAQPMGAHAADNINAMLNNTPLKPFAMRYYVQCISLGGHDALVQMQTSDGMPIEQIVTGRMGALIKELICKYTVLSLQVEKHLPGSYFIPSLPKSQQAQGHLIENTV
jgi:NADH dehydrogenase FAD-containing subunit